MKKVLRVSKQEDDERQLIGYPGFLFLLFYSILGLGFVEAQEECFWANVFFYMKGLLFSLCLYPAYYFALFEQWYVKPRSILDALGV